ncbi:Imm51 family immunity protein [Pedobacter borealis]|uniref:Imm51 family immunity protein n=1 Tax=Pedobacter borealis TaxID=475254 RepID=UPI0004934C92
MTECYPFLTKKTGNSIVANLESSDLYPSYYHLFKANGYEGNGYCWEGHVIQILEKLDPELHKQIEFDSETERFYCTCDSSEIQERFIKTLAPIFSEMDKLQSWISIADRSRIDD